MKKSGFFAASIAAASATAVTVSSSSHNSQHQHQDTTKAERRVCDEGSSSEKFAPRFDGLRFIETLITAHR